MKTISYEDGHTKIVKGLGKVSFEILNHNAIGFKKKFKKAKKNRYE